LKKTTFRNYEVAHPTMRRIPGFRFLSRGPNPYHFRRFLGISPRIIYGRGAHFKIQGNGLLLLAKKIQERGRPLRGGSRHMNIFPLKKNWTH